MPTNQPSTAPTDAKPQDRSADTAAAVLSDDQLDSMPGGGGLMGSNAGDHLSGTAMGKAGAATPNSPIDANLPDGGEKLAEREAQARATDDSPASS